MELTFSQLDDTQKQEVAEIVAEQADVPVEIAMELLEENDVEVVIGNDGDTSEDDGDTSEDDGDTSEDSVDVNGDGDVDVTITEDTAVVTADSCAEEEAAAERAMDMLGIEDCEETSVGKSKGELDEDTEDCELSDRRKKNIKGYCVSDSSQKNILSALIDKRF